MIYAFTGKTGSGKTFHMVRKAYRRWYNGTDVYSNTILMFGQDKAKIGLIERFFRFLGYIATFKFVLGHYTRPKRGRIIYFEDISEILEAKDGLILFDEAQVIFNARQWESLPAEFQYKLQQHRKHRLDLFATMQNMGTVDITYRRLVQKWFHHKCVFAIGQARTLLGLYIIEHKDVDELFNTVDDLVVKTEKWRPMFIWAFSRRLYDTFYDIGFKAFKLIWNSQFDESKSQMVSKAWIIPKQMSLKDALRSISSLQSGFQAKRSPTFYKISKTYGMNT